MKKPDTDVTVADVAENALEFFSSCRHPSAVSIFTPFVDRVLPEKIKLPSQLKDFIYRYEPKIVTEGLYPHQADFFKSYLSQNQKNFILTTATGSGKSLCFWSWVLQQMLEDPEATALLCFPTQALMWSQADRIARLSEKSTLVEHTHVAWGGEVKIGNKSIGWTVWKGVGSGYSADKAMQSHILTSTFKHARIRIATLDKAHFSLLQEPGFVKNLKCIVLDEAHMYQGMFGANVHFFLRRLFAAMELMHCSCPNIFMASATLSDAINFARGLTCIDNNDDITHIKDSITQKIEVVSHEEAIRQLNDPPAGGLLRMVLLLDQERGDFDVEKFLTDNSQVSSKLNIIYFSESKFHSKTFAMRLRSHKKTQERNPVIYDADLPPYTRRKIEAAFNSGAAQGITLIATNALELGVDIEGLDICVIDQIPAARQHLLQRIGRVGRRDGKPGLVILAASLEPQDRKILSNPTESFRLDTTKTLPLPTHVEMLRWRHLMAAFNEGIYRTYAGKNWEQFKRVMSKYFNECHSLDELKEQFKEAYGNVIDMEGRFWAHHGFRASASQGKIPLIEFGGWDGKKPVPKLSDGERHDIAWIEDTSLFRDAHPEAVFLGHGGGRWRIVAYDGNWQVAKNAPAGTEYILGKWLKTIKGIFVEKIHENVTTRGEWKDEHELYEIIHDLPDDALTPVEGSFEYGIFDFKRKWNGYRQIDLRTGNAKRITLAEVSRRFHQAVDMGEHFPYLHSLSYRTFGWRWNFGAFTNGIDINNNELREIALGLLEEFIQSVLECAPSDIIMHFSFKNNLLSCYDSAPGGNGLSQALLVDNRMKEAFQECLATLGSFRTKTGQKDFEKYIEGLLNIQSPILVKEVQNVINSLRKSWEG